MARHGPVDLPALPIVDTLDPLKAALSDHRMAVLVAPPGAGKTTLVPLALLDEAWLAGQTIVVLEPRRLATRAAAQRMAALLGEQVGDTVGYQTRDERRIGPATRIQVVTEGILTRRIQNDPELPGIGIVVFDEVHERNLPTDLGLALAVDVTASIRPDLRLLAMSATPDIAALTRLLGDPPVIVGEGREYPIEVRWRPLERNARIEGAVVDAVRVALRDDTGDLLVFLPGIGEIRRVESALASVVPTDVDVLPLAGALALAEQDRALAPPVAGRRRVVLATDIAETSLTVEGVRVVIDSGLARAPRFDIRTGMTRLTTITTSRASADQRAGRAGRLEPGVCYRLWSKVEHGSRSAHRTPEIEEVDLAGLALELAAWGTPADRLAWASAPPVKALRAGLDLLVDLGALDGSGRTTDLGRRMLGLPVHPRLAAMLVAEPTSLGCAIAAVVDERDILRGRHDDVPSDIGARLQLLRGDRPTNHDIDHRAVERVGRRAADLARRLGIRYDPQAINVDGAGAALLHAFPDRLAGGRRPGQFQLRSGSGAWLPDGDPLAREPFIVAADLDGRRDRSRIRLAAPVDADDVVNQFKWEVAQTVRLEWDTDRDDVVERVERRLGALRLGEAIRPPSPGPDVVAALLARARATGLAVLGWSTASIALRQRVDYLHRTLGEPWPDWSVEALTSTLDDWLLPFLDNATRRADLERLDMSMILRSQLAWPLGAELDQLAPTALVLPTGRTAAIAYSGDEPAAHVRVHDLFGVTTHPTAGGRPIVLHLLSPADRPIQITADLPGFWAGSWADVRRQMAGRYPKHQWPVDPATADPRRLKRTDSD